ncbi:HDOD domain-containing protein [Ideonella dechloratans]|uniref:HDOD domain-containing protein n=2 Tax=Ideonella dechloratans TaxID=36863 RepID=A0A643FEI4_IDEDE|nr:HDOD domain-containing protein [Ideonella dechloratans]
MSSAASPSQDSVSPARSASTAGGGRMFGRFQLLALLGKSERTMMWAAVDTRQQQDCMLAIPRKQPEGEAVQAWHRAVRKGARLEHPHLAPAVEVGEHERWPYAMYDRSATVTWAERFSQEGLPPTDVANWVAGVAQGLAYAHEAGVAHGDIQPWMLGVTETGTPVLMGLEVAGRDAWAARDGAMQELRAVREAAERDVLALGLVTYQALAGAPALDEPDVGRAIARMPPSGNEIVRLPWALSRPVPDALRAIVNRATDRQPRHRYHNARVLQGALEGWLRTQAESDGPLALLMDRIQSAGVLPAQPGGAERAAHLALMDNSRTSELADVVLGDIALTFELLRLVNSAQVSAEGPVLMLRRAIAMLGLEGVRRAALGLRRWPGPMNAPAAAEMEQLIARVHRAGRLAVRLAPAGYDSEVVYLITLMQNLGRLVVQYHFPEEAHQIRRLMQHIEAAPGEQAQPGLSAEAASYAVLGVDTEELGLAVARHWGLDGSVLRMIRRVVPSEAHRGADDDGDVLRYAASCANEMVDAAGLPPQRAQLALKQAAQRYVRVLGLTSKELADALQAEIQASADPASLKLPEGVIASSASRTPATGEIQPAA